MFKVEVNNNSFSIDLSDKGEITIDGQAFDWDKAKIDDRTFNVVYNNKSHNVEILSVKKEEKKATLKINNKVVSVSIKDKLDLLLERLGMDNLVTNQVNDIKAPMPGLIIEINVKAGDEVKAGDKIMILEAMKMENVLKSPGDGVIKEIKVAKGDSVEKNQVLILF